MERRRVLLIRRAGTPRAATRLTPRGFKSHSERRASFCPLASNSLLSRPAATRRGRLVAVVAPGRVVPAGRDRRHLLGGRALRTPPRAYAPRSRPGPGCAGGPGAPLMPRPPRRGAATASSATTIGHATVRIYTSAMTAQISDSVRFEGRTYSLVGVNGSGLFDPEALGLRAVASSTACWRGFYCTYTVRGRSKSDRGPLRLQQELQQPGLVALEIVSAIPRRTDPLRLDEVSADDRWLELDDLNIRLASPQRPPILGVEPKSVPGRGDVVYVDMRAPIAFTGGFLIGDDFIVDMGVNMGFAPAYNYRVVHELIFEEGRLASATDQSELMAKIRDNLGGKPLVPDTSASDTEGERWVESTFSLKYW